MKLQLRPTTVSTEGEGIAWDENGRVVFVDGALPGETVVAEVVAERSKSARAALVEVLEPSADRVLPPCPNVALGCGGCGWQHVSLTAQRRLKGEIVTNALKRAGIELSDVPVDTVELPDWSYRTTLRLGIAGDGGAGYRMVRSNDVLPVSSCPVAHPLLQDLLKIEYSGAREVLLRCGATTGDRLVATAPGGLELELPEGVSRTHIHEEVAGRRWRVSAESFFQSRPDGAEALAGLVCAAAENFGDPGRAIDLYSGVGLFAGVIADRGWRVIAVESSPYALADARINLEGTEVRLKKAEVEHWSPARAELVVADPPRRGLGRRGAEVVAATGAQRVVLISCDAVGLARDAAFLAGQSYRLTSLTLVDMFPHTSHVEVVSIYDRSG